ncbi:Fic family protein [Candidatus Gottesmanbacteria bacterium]|nr:Fic family protein [Candidatus Gottesmanbacteria bacterium]
MRDILSRIHQKKQRLDTFQSLSNEISKNLDEWFRIELTYTSNAIEGNTLSRIETALVVEKGITVEGKSIKEHLEAVNHAKAYQFIQTLTDKTKTSITERTILDIHSLILQNIDTVNAGRYRTIPVRIAGSTAIMPNAIKVPDLMSEFIKWLHHKKEGIVKIAADAHFKLVSIHPFTDGNGRTARLLMNLILMQAGYPPAIIRKEDRRTYINSIEKGQLSGDLSEYYPVVFSAVERSLDIFLSTLEEKKGKPEFLKKKLMTIGKLAKESNETVSTIRYWTKEGLLKPSQISKGGYQLYNPDTIKIIKKIRKLQKEKRLTIQELKQVMGKDHPLY